MAPVARVWLLGLPLVAGCLTEISLNKNKDEDAPNVDADADTDADADSDTDSDTDTDSDADTDPSSDLDCDADWLTGLPAPGDAGLGTCVTQEVFCGDVIHATNVGGSVVYDYAFWEDMGSLGSLFGEFDALDGPERSFVFRGVQAGEVLHVSVESCMDVWPTWIRYGDIGGEYCDLNTFNTGGIWEDKLTARSWSTDRLNPSSASGYDFELVIEGLYGATGNFVMTVECL